MVNDRLRRLETGAIDETRKLFGIFMYFWVLLSLFSFHKALILNEESLIFHQGFALINALALAKVVMVGEFFHVGDNVDNRPLIYPILFKSAIFAVLLIAFHIIEETFLGVLHGKTLSQSIPSIGGGRLQGILMVGITMFVVLMPFFAFRELDRAIGKEELRALLFGDKSEAHTAPRRGWRPASGAALAVLVLGGGWFIWPLNRNTAAHYVTQKLDRGSVVRTVTASGLVGAAATAPVSARVSGVIQALGCDADTKVKAGQLCAKIDPRPYQIMVDEDKSDLAQAEARFEKDKADLARSKTVFEHDEALARRRTISRKAIDKSRAACERVQARTGLDEATVVRLQAALHDAEASLEYTDIVAPVSGTVISRNVEIGQTVAASSQAPPLFLIATDLSIIQVNAKVGEDDMSEIKVGDKASFTVESLSDQAFAGEVIQNATTYELVISAPNPELSLEPGMIAAITVTADRRDNVLRAADQALRYSPVNLEADLRMPPDGSSRLWILRAGKPTAIPVQLGLDDGIYTEVVKGDMQPGDELIIGERGGVFEKPTEGPPPLLQRKRKT